MTAFSTRCSKRPDPAALLLFIFFAWFIGISPVFAEGIDVRRATLTPAEDAYVLEAQFDIALTHSLEDALNKGVPLYFVLELEVIRPRWYWFNERVAGSQQTYRLSFNTLTRQYRVGAGTLHQNFPELAEALQFMSIVRRRQDIEPGALQRGSSYVAAVRLRLDTTQLPKPFQLNALGSREWSLASDWFRWTVAP
mgnify:CR=1 FL=1